MFCLRFNVSNKRCTFSGLLSRTSFLAKTVIWNFKNKISYQNGYRWIALFPNVYNLLFLIQKLASVSIEIDYSSRVIFELISLQDILYIFYIFRVKYVLWWQNKHVLKFDTKTYVCSCLRHKNWAHFAPIKNKKQTKTLFFVQKEKYSEKNCKSTIIFYI